MSVVHMQFYWLAMSHYVYPLRLRKYRVITCISENIFYVGEAYLSDSTNYASPSSHIARK